MITPQMLLYGLSAVIAVASLPAIVNPRKFNKAVKELLSKREMIRISGVFALIISFLFLSVHWKLSGKWMMTISIIGWISFIKGVARLWWPDFVRKQVKKFFKKENTTVAFGLIGIIIAAGLSYIAMEIITIGEIVAG